jgi:hypothetical protein
VAADDPFEGDCDPQPVNTSRPAITNAGITRIGFHSFAEGTARKFSTHGSVWQVTEVPGHAASRKQIRPCFDLAPPRRSARRASAFDIKITLTM